MSQFNKDRQKSRKKSKTEDDKYNKAIEMSML